MSKDNRGFTGLSDLTTDITDVKSKSSRSSEPQSAINQRAAPEKDLYNSTISNQRDEVPQGPSAITIFFRKLFELLLSIPLIFYIGGGVVLFIYIDDQKEKNALKPFNENMASILKITDKSNYRISPTGKTLPVNLATRTVDKAYFSISERFRPTSIDEITTIIGYDKCTENVIGEYTDGADAIQISCNIFIIDKNTGKWTFAGNIEGGEPPQTKKGAGNRKGRKPIYTYLTRLNMLGK